jgi:hypothetical protein
MTARRRFDQVELGEALPSAAVAAPADGAPLVGPIARFVAAWAGQDVELDGVRVLRHPPPTAPVDVLRLAGRVYGRHMDGSRRIEVEVTGHDGSGHRLCGMVRVKLA